MGEKWQDDTRTIPDLDFVAKHIVAAGHWLGWDFAGNMDRFLRSFPAESPIEAVFLAWWDAMLRARRIYDRVELHTQYATRAQGNDYRIDFVLMPPIELCDRARTHGVKWQRIAIEVDGHEFHERTKEQVAYRNQRDRDLVAAGWVVLHFSGSEINRDPRGCVQQAYDQASDLFLTCEMQVEAAEYEATKVVGA